MTGVDAITRTVQQTQEWLGQLAERLEVDDDQYAYRALRTVLHVLRDRLGVEVSAHVSAQLPMLLRGTFYEGWDPTGTPIRLSLDEFLDRIEADGFFKGRSEAEDVARAVFALLWDELGEGTVRHITAVLPDDYAVLY